MSKAVLVAHTVTTRPSPIWRAAAMVPTHCSDATPPLRYVNAVATGRSPWYATTILVCISATRRCGRSNSWMKTSAGMPYVP